MRREVITARFNVDFPIFRGDSTSLPDGLIRSNRSLRVVARPTSCVRVVARPTSCEPGKDTLLPRATNSYEQQLLHNLKTWGWSFTHVLGSEDEPCFSYSIGLLFSYAHPEIIVLGLSKESSHGLVSRVAQRAAQGDPIDLVRPSKDLVHGYTFLFNEVGSIHREKYAKSDCWLYGGNDFPLYQLIWPSEAGLFPWHPLAPESYRIAQPILGHAARGL